MGIRDQSTPNNLKGPIPIRRNVEDFDDPYITDEQLPEKSVCKRCNSVFMQGRWYSNENIPSDVNLGEDVNITVCPACQKQLDQYPGGILKITGSFFFEHEEDILNLIHNEEHKAQVSNPLERIMKIDSQGDVVEISTTNEGLVQRIGKALHRAYKGHIEYKWSDNNKLARINWHRNV